MTAKSIHFQDVTPNVGNCLDVQLIHIYYSFRGIRRLGIVPSVNAEPLPTTKSAMYACFGSRAPSVAGSHRGVDHRRHISTIALLARMLQLHCFKYKPRWIVSAPVLRHSLLMTSTDLSLPGTLFSRVCHIGMA